MKQITFGLSIKEVNSAINELRKYRMTIEERLLSLSQVLANHGKDAVIQSIGEVVIHANVAEMLKAGVDSVYDPSTGVVVIFNSVPWAAYVEFGTGIVGRGSPHPMGEGYLGWYYDIHEHGFMGWWYYLGGNLHHTWGQESQPFMYLAGQRLREDIRRIVRDHLGGTK